MAKFKAVKLKKVQEQLIEAFKQRIGEPTGTHLQKNETCAVEGKYDRGVLCVFVANPYEDMDGNFCVAPYVDFLYKVKVSNGAAKAAKIRKFNSENKYFNAAFWEIGNEIWISHTDFLVRAEDAKEAAEQFFTDFLHKTNQANINAVLSNY